jgi:hypothetical protein
MIDGIFTEAVAEQLRARFPNVYVGLPQDDGRVTMPAIVLELRSDTVLSSPLQRGHLTTLVCSQADDTTPDQHYQLCYDVSTFMKTLTINSTKVQLHGIKPFNSDQQHAERHWQTPMQYIVGFSPI